MAHFTHHSEENYLKTLYKLSHRQVRKVNNITLAKELQLNPASVLEMVRKLVKRRLVKLMPDKTILLTEAGNRKALLTIRRHRLWEVFLVEKLNYTWNEVHVLAEQLEHVESDDLVDRLENFLGNPAIDPHGDPIPDKLGRIKARPAIPLSQSQPGRTYIVSSLVDTQDSFLQYLGKLGIMPGTKLKLDEHNEYDHSSLVKIKNKPVQLSEKVAGNILVEMAG